MFFISILVLLMCVGTFSHPAKAVPPLPPDANKAILDRPDAKAAPPGPIAEPAPLSRTDIATYKLAFQFAKKKNWNAARRRGARGRHPLPRKILQWLEMTQSGSSYSFAQIVNFAIQNPDWPLPNTLRNRAEEAITETTPPETVMAWFANRPPRTTDGKIAYGQALIAAGRADDGHAHLRDAWVFGRFSRREEGLFMRQYRKRYTKLDHWERLDNLLWNGHHRQAIRNVPCCWLSPVRKAIFMLRPSAAPAPEGLCS